MDMYVADRNNPRAVFAYAYAQHLFYIKMNVLEIYYIISGWVAMNDVITF